MIDADYSDFGQHADKAGKCRRLAVARDKSVTRE